MCMEHQTDQTPSAEGSGPYEEGKRAGAHPLVVIVGVIVGRPWIHCAREQQRPPVRAPARQSRSGRERSGANRFAAAGDVQRVDLARFVALMHDAGTVPTVENMPPVLRMRRDDFAFTPIGMASEDLRWLVERLPGLRVLPDTSHAGLYLNARSLEPDPACEWSAPLAKYLTQLPAEASGLVG